jgi:hypothetical protein
VRTTEGFTVFGVSPRLLGGRKDSSRLVVGVEGVIVLAALKQMPKTVVDIRERRFGFPAHGRTRSSSAASASFARVRLTMSDSACRGRSGDRGPFFWSQFPQHFQYPLSGMLRLRGYWHLVQFLTARRYACGRPPACIWGYKSGFRCGARHRHDDAG